MPRGILMTVPLLVLVSVVGVLVFTMLGSRTAREPKGPQPISLWTTGGSITDIAFSPDDQFLAVGMHDGSIEIRRVIDGSLAYVLKGHTGEVKTLAFSPNGQVLASGESSYYDTSNDAANKQAAIRLWSVKDGALLHILQGHKVSVDALAFSPDGQMLASDGVDRTIRLWTTAGGLLQSAFKGPQAPFGIFKLVFSQDGRVLTATDGVGNVQQRSLPDGSILHTYANGNFHGGPSRGLDISRDSRIIIGSDYGDPDIHVWQLGSDHLLSTYSGHRSGVGVLTVSPNGRLVASAGGYLINSSDEQWIGKDNAVRVWQAEDGGNKLILEGFEGTVTSLAWRSDTKLLATGNDDGTVRLWSVK